MHVTRAVPRLRTLPNLIPHHPISIPVKFNFEAGARRYHRGVPWRITAYEGASAFLADHTETNPVWFRVQPEKLFRVQETDISNYEAGFYRRNS